MTYFIYNKLLFFMYLVFYFKDVFLSLWVDGWWWIQAVF